MAGAAETRTGCVQTTITSPPPTGIILDQMEMQQRQSLELKQLKAPFCSLRHLLKKPNSWIPRKSDLEPAKRPKKTTQQLPYMASLTMNHFGLLILTPPLTRRLVRPRKNSKAGSPPFFGTNNGSVASPSKPLLSGVVLNRWWFNLGHDLLNQELLGKVKETSSCPLM